MRFRPCIDLHNGVVKQVPILPGFRISTRCKCADNSWLYSARAAHPSCIDLYQFYTSAWDTA
jgi:hypothetical protein